LFNYLDIGVVITSVILCILNSKRATPTKPPSQQSSKPKPTF